MVSKTELKAHAALPTKPVSAVIGCENLHCALCSLFVMRKESAEIHSRRELVWNVLFEITPQEFSGHVPEPSCLSLFLSVTVADHLLS